MVRVFTFLLFIMATPCPSEIGLPLWYQEMSMGRSPLCIEQTTDTNSPEFTASFPKSNGAIWGGTEKGALQIYKEVCNGFVVA